MYGLLLGGCMLCEFLAGFDCSVLVGTSYLSEGNYTL